ncbi:MAG: hypothetical protein ACTHM1_03940 [Solirubrobacteraceae bacterium]
MSLLLASLCAVLLGSLGGSAAWGAIAHKYLSRITEVPAGPAVGAPGPLGEVNAMAADSGSLYVAENARQTTPESLDEFDASTGAFVRQFALPSSLHAYYYFGLAAGHATGEEQVYVGAEDNEYKDFVAVFDGEGHPLGIPWEGTPSGPFTPLGIGGIAADGRASALGWSAGDVYVSDRSNKVVDVFKPTPGNSKEEYVTKIEGPEAGVPFGEPSLVAVNQSNGDVVVVDQGDIVYIFEPAALEGYALVAKITGTPQGPFGTIQGKALAVDANGDIYVSEGGLEGPVYEFNEKGEYLGRVTGTPAGTFHAVNSLAVDPATHDLYVGDREDFETGQPGAIDVFGPDVVVPDVTTGPASSVSATSATLSGTVNPDGAGEATCRFAWGASAQLANTVSCASPIPNGEAPTPVEQTLSGLSPDTTYSYRLQASNEQGVNPGEPSQNLEFHTPGAGIHQEWTTEAAFDSVTLGAKIDPNGSPTTYQFQYGTSSEYGSDAPASAGSSIGSSAGDVTVTQHLQGLLSDKVYHYRVVARSELPGGEVVEFSGPDQTFATQAATSEFKLPDGRAWEMVSPPNKDGAALEPPMNEQGIAMQASADGSAVSYTANTATEDQPSGNRSLEPTQLLSRRAAGGWSTRVITTHFEEVGNVKPGLGAEYRFFSADLSTAALLPWAETKLSEEATEHTPYLRHDFACETSPATCYQPLVTASNVEPAGLKFGKSAFGLNAIFPLIGTPDLSHVVIDSGEVPLLPSSSTEFGGKYEWSGGKLQPVTVLPNGNPAPGDSFIGNMNNDMRHAISDDGSRVVFTTDNETGGQHLFTRDTVTGTTTQVDIIEPGARGGSPEPTFQLASSNGMKIFFTDTAQLTADSTASAPYWRDLYEFDLNTGKVTDLTVDRNQYEHASVAGLVQGTSEDGSYVYFIASGVLAPGATPGHGCEEENPSDQTACNLYVRHAGTTTFIATLSGRDQRLNGERSSAKLEDVTARVSPDGRWFAFMSDRSLTGYDNRDASSGEPDEEVFLYDASTGHLSCASCNPTGGRPAGSFSSEGSKSLGTLVDRTGIWTERWLAALLPGWDKVTLETSVYQSRYLSDSGRLFFMSSDALVPQDVNGTMDVYEFEPEGVGDCGSASATFQRAVGGCVSLISSGGSAEESAFMDASENGNDVFFLTAAKLRPEDYDNGLDLYDARVCSKGSPCIPTPPTGPPPCSTGDSCKPAPAPQPTIFGAAPSATFSGIGNAAPGASGATVHRSLTRAQKLARALRVCKRKHGKRRRTVCERQARKLYGAKVKARKSTAHRARRSSVTSNPRARR